MIHHVIVVFLRLDGIIDDSKNVIIQEITAKICASCEALGKAFLGEANSTKVPFRYNPSFV